MGTYLHPDKFKELLYNSYVFDLEYIGTSTQLETCFIWDICCMHLPSGRHVELTIHPDIHPLPPPFGSDFIQVTKSLLTQRRAVPFAQAWNTLRTFINATTGYPTAPVVFIAHNAFKADKLMLEIDCTRHHIKIPYRWYFFDSLLYCRKQITKHSSYALNDLHRHLFHTNIAQQHFAMSDTVALRNILVSIGLDKLEGPVYPAHCTALQAVKWLGSSSEHILFSHGIRSVEDLVQKVVVAYCDSQFLSVTVSLQPFIRNYLMSNYAIKQGNASSIADSLAQKWISGV